MDESCFICNGSRNGLKYQQQHCGAGLSPNPAKPVFRRCGNKVQSAVLPVTETWLRFSWKGSALFSATMPTPGIWRNPENFFEIEFKNSNPHPGWKCFERLRRSRLDAEVTPSTGDVTSTSLSTTAAATRCSESLSALTLTSSLGSGAKLCHPWLSLEVSLDLELNHPLCLNHRSSGPASSYTLDSS